MAGYEKATLNKDRLSVKELIKILQGFPEDANITLSLTMNKDDIETFGKQGYKITEGPIFVVDETFENDVIEISIRDWPY